MRILFLGTPEYALRSLERLAALHEIVGVISQPDRPVGRKGRTEPTPTARFAREHGVRLFQPERPRGRALRAELAGLGAELSVVVAYGHILRPWLIELAPAGMLNAHGSLLPRHRGAAPVQRAILAGDAETGVTVQRVVPQVDAGPILLAERTPIGAGETSGQLLERLARLSGECLCRGVELVSSGRAQFTPQDERLVTHAPKITAEEGAADWSHDAAYLARAARAFNPWPTLHTRLPDGRLLKILQARAEPQAAAGAEPGTLLRADHGELSVATGSGVLHLLALQAEGRKAMAAADFLRGIRLSPGQRLG